MTEKMPDEIWVDKYWRAYSTDQDMEGLTYTEFVRKDIHQAVAAENEKLRAVVEEMKMALELVKRDSIHHDATALECRTLGKSEGNLFQCLELVTRVACEKALAAADEVLK